MFNVELFAPIVFEPLGQDLELGVDGYLDWVIDVEEGPRRRFWRISMWMGDV